MEKFIKILGLVFSGLTLIGGGYVLYTGGEASPGYAIVPLAFALTCQTYLDASKKLSKPKTSDIDEQDIESDNNN